MPHRYPKLKADGFDSIEANETRAEKFWKRIPILGRTIAVSLWDARVHPIVEQVNSQLRQRAPIEEDEWGSDPARLEAAKFISLVAQRQIGWVNDRFSPLDPVSIVFWAHEDGLDDIAALQEIESEFDIKIEDSHITEIWQLNLSEFVNWVFERQASKP